MENKEEKPADLSKPFSGISLQTQKDSTAQKFAKERKHHNKVRKEKTNTKKSLAHKEKSLGLKKVRAKKKAKKVRTKRIRLSKDNKNQRFLGSFRNQRFQKEKQGALNQWIRLANLDIEKLKIEIRLLSLSPNPEDIRKLRDSIAKLKGVIDRKIRENTFSKLKTK
ncbi:MAG: hypothetical protein AABX63_00835 [Nanoarchaeota archaeon]